MITRGLIFLCIYVTGLQCISQISNEEISCPDGYVQSSDKTQCLPYVTEFYGRCKEDVQCEWLGKDSVCYGYCICKPNFIWYQGKCQKYSGLNEECSVDLYCYDGNDPRALTCDSTTNKCTCASDYYLRDNTDCRKKSKENGICAINADCRDPKLSCVLGNCTKASKLFDLNEETELIIPEKSIFANVVPTTCENDDNCKNIENSYCYSKTCVCKQGYFFATDGDETNVKCVPEIGVKSGCTSDANCLIKPGVCDVDTGTCYCRDYYVLEDGNKRCVKTMSQNNNNCVTNQWCSVLGEYAYCSSDGKCSCSPGTELDEENMLCRLTGDPIKIECKKDTDCFNKIYNSVCLEEKCQCSAGNKIENEMCAPGIGSYCNPDYDLICGLNSFCNDDNICECEENFIAVDNTCYPVTNQLDDNCKVDAQCGIKNSHCNEDNKCTCLDNFLTKNNQCFERKAINDYCTSSLVCTVSLGESFVCRKQKCTCPTQSTLIGDKCSGVAKISENFLLIFIVILVNWGLFFVC